VNIAMVDDNQADLDKMKGALKEYAAERGADITFHPFLSTVNNLGYKFTER
jgi:hypothetical protein